LGAFGELVVAGDVVSLGETLEDLGVEMVDLAGDPPARIVGIQDRGEVSPAEGVLGQGAVAGVRDREVVSDGVGVAGGLSDVADVLQTDRPEDKLGRVVHGDAVGLELLEVLGELFWGDAP
jgi:hypothetical protein